MDWKFPDLACIRNQKIIQLGTSSLPLTRSAAFLAGGGLVSDIKGLLREHAIAKHRRLNISLLVKTVDRDESIVHNLPEVKLRRPCLEPSKYDLRNRSVSEELQRVNQMRTCVRRQGRGCSGGHRSLCIPLVVETVERDNSCVWDIRSRTGSCCSLCEPESSWTPLRFLRCTVR